jgi:hypothetical protein
VKASNTDAGDIFGGAVALSADGSTLAVGARLEASRSRGVGADQTDNTSFSVGAVYVFTRSGSSWSQQEYIKASDAWSGDQFGSALDLSASANALAVVGKGKAYIFARSGGVWTEQTSFSPAMGESGDRFGESMALSDDGATLAVGAPDESSSATGVGGSEANNAATSSGAAYIFTRSGSSWTQAAYLKASNTEANDRFGTFLALSGDGATVAVASPDEDSNATLIDGSQGNNAATSSGAVYVFRRSGASWSQQAYIKASNADAEDGFGGELRVLGSGTGVSLSVDGSTLAVGAIGEASPATGLDLPGDQGNDLAGGVFYGAAYIYTRSGAAWSWRAYVKATGVSHEDDAFGTAVALSGDGATLVCGADSEGSNATGIDGDQTDTSAVLAGAVYAY